MLGGTCFHNLLRRLWHEMERSQKGGRQVTYTCFRRSFAHSLCNGSILQACAGLWVAGKSAYRRCYKLHGRRFGFLGAEKQKAESAIRYGFNTGAWKRKQRPLGLYAHGYNTFSNERRCNGRRLCCELACTGVLRCGLRCAYIFGCGVSHKTCAIWRRRLWRYLCYCHSHTILRPAVSGGRKRLSKLLYSWHCPWQHKNIRQNSPCAFLWRNNGLHTDIAVFPPWTFGIPVTNAVNNTSCGGDSIVPYIRCKTCGCYCYHEAFRCKVEADSPYLMGRIKRSDLHCFRYHGDSWWRIYEKWRFPYRFLYRAYVYRYSGYASAAVC